MIGLRRGTSTGGKSGCGYWAFCDQIIDGKPIGSKYYPRGVTNILWLPDLADIRL